MNGWMNEWICAQNVDDWICRQSPNVTASQHHNYEIWHAEKVRRKWLFIALMDSKLGKSINNLIKNINFIVTRYSSNILKYFLIGYTWKILQNLIILWK